LLKSTVILVFVFGVHYFFLIVPMNWLNKDQQTLPMVICLYVENIPNSLQVHNSTSLLNKLQENV